MEGQLAGSGSYGLPVPSVPDRLPATADNVIKALDKVLASKEKEIEELHDLRDFLVQTGADVPQQIILRLWGEWEWYSYDREG